MVIPNEVIPPNALAIPCDLLLLPENGGEVLALCGA